MSRGRRNARDNVSMNLFPFLAVLICTMGSLIVLLVVMVQQARVRADTPARDPEIAVAPVDGKLATDRAEELASQQELAAKRQEEIEDYQWQAEMLRSSYAAASEQLSEQRLALSHLEDHSRELLTKAQQMQDEADAIARAKEVRQHDQVEKKQKLAELGTLIAAASDELDQARKELAGKRKTHALIPYDGPNGTRRRPIYIECLPNRVILQPEGIELTGTDFQEPLTISNPLAVALRAKREFLLNQGLLEPGQEPYPLLVVRPHSASAYAAARGAMKAWEAEFGYELVEDSIELEFPPRDPQLTRILHQVIHEARDKRRLIQVVRAREQEPSRQSGLLRPSANGGFEPVGGGGSSIVTSRGRGSGGSGDGDGFGDEANGELADGDFGGGRGGRFGDSSRGGGNGARRSAAQSGKRSFDAQSLGGQSPGSLRGGQSSGTGGSSSGLSRFADSADDGFGDNESGQGNRAGQGGQLGQGGTDGEGTSPTDSMGSAGQPGEKQFASMGASSDSQQAKGSGSSGGNGNGNAQANAGGSSGAATSSQSSSAAGSAGMSQLSSVSSMANSRGRNWALTDVAVDAIAIRRPIRVICDQQRLTITPEKGTEDRIQAFAHDGSLAGVMDPFVDTIRKRTRSWGLAGQGIYWQPVLHVDVGDGADENYQQLVRLLENSGVQVTRQP